MADEDQALRPAYYAARTGGWRDWWTLLHPPYTAWHLSYVVIGATLAPRVSTTRLLATLLAFFAAVGLAAHALDELKGRPLRTSIPTPALVAVSVVGLAIAVGLGVAGLAKVGWVLVPFIVVGPLLVVAYNAEMFGGLVHTDAGFAAAWGAFPVLTAYVAQAQTLALAPVLAAAGAFALSAAQRSLSTPARMIRRRVSSIEGTLDSDRRIDATGGRQIADQTPRAGAQVAVVVDRAGGGGIGGRSSRLRMIQRRPEPRRGGGIVSIYGPDIYTEPAGDPDTLANLGPLRPMAGVWEGTKGSDQHPVRRRDREERFRRALRAATDRPPDQRAPALLRPALPHPHHQAG